MLALQAGLLVWQAHHAGITVDEPAHLVSSYLYWQGRDILLPRDMPPLIKAAAGAVPTSAELGFNPLEIRPGEWEWDFANRVMHRDNPQWIGPLFARARLPLILFPLLTSLLIFLWARVHLGSISALAAVFLFAFDPTSLGHGSLIKNDHAATCTGFLFSLAASRYSARPSTGNLGLLSGAVWLAVSAKLSLLICFPAAIAVIAFSLRSWLLVPHALLLTVTLYAGMCAASWFDLVPLTPVEFQESSVANLASRFSQLLKPLFTEMPVPRLYWNGINALLYWNADAGNPIYFLGQHVPQGSVWYFVVCILVKVSEGFLALFAAGLAGACALGRRKACFLLLPAAIYFGAASSTAMQLGIRLILPVLPFAALIAASVFSRPLPAWGRNLAVAALAAAGLSSAFSFPHGIGYFNQASGGNTQALGYLADSNLDWGQDLPALREWMDQAAPPKIKLYYFGNDNPFRFFNDDEIEPMAPPWGPDLVSSDRLAPAPGYYVISANLLPGHAFAPQFKDYFTAFRKRTPLAIAGSSLYIFRIP